MVEPAHTNRAWKYTPEIPALTLREVDGGRGVRSSRLSLATQGSLSYRDSAPTKRKLLHKELNGNPIFAAATQVIPRINGNNCHKYLYLEVPGKAGALGFSVAAIA